MNIMLWVVQVLLALVFVAHGCLFLFPPAQMLELMKPIPTAFRLSGVAEVLAGLGLTLPGITRILPWLVRARPRG
jgi:uncharacterized membrane protein YphA (DoxX/SURF4 family)